MAFYAAYLLSLGACSAARWAWAASTCWASPWPRLQALWHYTLIRGRTREGCFKAFRLNHWLGFAVFAGVALDLALR